MSLDLGLQVLDNVIMTRWKVLPREQCQGNLKAIDGLVSGANGMCRNSQLCSQLHHTELKFRGDDEDPSDTFEQAEFGPGLNSEARMAP